jgi:hypothetical protein
VYHIGDSKLLGFEYDELLCVSRRTPSRKRHRPQVRGSKYRLCRLTRHWKRKHHSAESAEVARGEMQRKYPQYDYRAYACRCGAWHVGRDVRKAREEKVMSVEDKTARDQVEAFVLGTRLNTAETRELHRYLGGLVLPKVERFELHGLDSQGLPFPAYRHDILEDCQVLGAGADSPGIVIDDNNDECFTPTQARALAACLLAAADEAEGL